MRIKQYSYVIKTVLVLRSGTRSKVQRGLSRVSVECFESGLPWWKSYIMYDICVSGSSRRVMICSDTDTTHWSTGWTDPANNACRWYSEGVRRVLHPPTEPNAKTKCKHVRMKTGIAYINRNKFFLLECLHKMLPEKAALRIDRYSLVRLFETSHADLRVHHRPPPPTTPFATFINSNPCLPFAMFQYWKVFALHAINGKIPKGSPRMTAWETMHNYIW